MLKLSDDLSSRLPFGFNLVIKCAGIRLHFLFHHILRLNSILILANIVSLG
jgi:hypothetical protein